MAIAGVKPPAETGATSEAPEKKQGTENDSDCEELFEGCGCTRYTTVCHDLCTPYSEAGCYLCYTRTYHIGTQGKHVGELDGELAIVCPYEKVDCVSTC